MTNSPSSSLPTFNILPQTTTDVDFYARVAAFERNEEREARRAKAAYKRFLATNEADSGTTEAYVPIPIIPRYSAARQPPPPTWIPVIRNPIYPFYEFSTTTSQEQPLLLAQPYTQQLPFPPESSSSELPVQQSPDRFVPPRLTPLLAPTLLYDPATNYASTKLHYDLRMVPHSIRLSNRVDPSLRTSNSERYLSRSDVRDILTGKSAFSPSQQSVQIISNLFPWTIEIQAGTSGRISIYDIISTVHYSLHEPLTRQEWETLPQSHQDRILRTREREIFPSSSRSPSICKWREFMACIAIGRICAANNSNDSSTTTHPKERHILPALWERTSVPFNEKPIRTAETSLLRIDLVSAECNSTAGRGTRWAGLVRDDVLASTRGIPSDAFDHCWCLLLE